MWMDAFFQYLCPPVFSDIFLMNWLLLHTCLFFCCKSSRCVWGTGGGASALPCQWWRKCSHSFVFIFISCVLPCAVEFYFYLVKPMKLIFGQFLQLLMCLEISPSILSSYKPSRIFFLVFCTHIGLHLKLYMIGKNVDGRRMCGAGCRTWRFLCLRGRGLHSGAGCCSGVVQVLQTHWLDYCDNYYWIIAVQCPEGHVIMLPKCPASSS